MWQKTDAHVVNALNGLAFLAAAQNQAERAVRLWGISTNLREETGMSLASNDQNEYERVLGESAKILGEQGFKKAWSKGRTMALKQAIEYALENGRQD